MKAAVIHQYGGPEIINYEEVAFPVFVKPKVVHCFS